VNVVRILEYAAWIISAVLVAWMIYDATKVSREYDEDYLISRVDEFDTGAH
jgi:hypothetical protein